MVSTKTDHLKQPKYLSLFLCRYLKKGYCEIQDDAANQVAVYVLFLLVKY